MAWWNRIRKTGFTCSIIGVVFNTALENDNLRSDHSGLMWHDKVIDLEMFLKLWIGTPFFQAAVNQFSMCTLQNAAPVAAMLPQISQFRHVCSFHSMEDSSLSHFPLFFARMDSARFFSWSSLWAAFLFPEPELWHPQQHSEMSHFWANSAIFNTRGVLRIWNDSVFTRSFIKASSVWTRPILPSDH